MSELQLDVPRARLEDWHIINGTIWGKAYDDRLNTFKEGEVIITSPLSIIDFDAGLAWTQNSLYRLGEPFKNNATVFANSYADE